MANQGQHATQQALAQCVSAATTAPTDEALDQANEPVAQLRVIRGDLRRAKAIALKLGLAGANATHAHQLVDEIIAALTVESSCYTGDLIVTLTTATYSIAWDLCTTDDED